MVMPQRKGSSAPPVVMMKIRNERGKRQRRPCCRRSVRWGSQIHLCIRTGHPQFGIRSVDKSLVRDNPLSVERSECIRYWFDNTAQIFSHWERAIRESWQPFLDHPLAVAISKAFFRKMRVKQFFFFLCRDVNQEVSSFAQRPCVRGDNPSPTRHYA